MVSAVQQSFAGQKSIQLPPPPPPGNPPGRLNVPTVIDTNANPVEASFGRRGTNQPDNNSVSNVSIISINGQSYSGAIYDVNVNRIA